MEAGELKRLIGYHYWASQRLLDSVERLSQEQYAQRVDAGFMNVQDLLAHLIHSDTLLLGAMEDEPVPGVQPKDFPTAAAARARWGDLERRVRDAAERLTPERLAEPVGGGRFRPARWQMLHHLLNHGTHHRGQLLAFLCLIGVDVPSTDLFLYDMAEAGLKVPEYW